MGLFVRVERVLPAPLSISCRIFMSHSRKNLASVFFESERAKHETSCDVARAELVRTLFETSLKTMSRARSNMCGESWAQIKSHAACREGMVRQ